MSTNPLPPNPCLVAIFLIVKSSSDPSIVFHYPPRPGEDNSRFKDLVKDTAGEDESTASSSAEDSPDSVAETPKSRQETEVNGKKDSPLHGDAFGSASPEKSNGLRAPQKWNDIFGYQSSVLAKLLTPATTGNKKRYEVGLGDRVMLGRPVFAKPDGTWKKTKKPRRSSSRSNITAEKTKKDRENMKGAKAKNLGIEETDHSETSAPELSADGQSDVREETKNRRITPDLSQHMQYEKGDAVKKSAKNSNTSKITYVAKKPLAMFHVVYVLQPPPLQYHVRVEEMYDCIVRKLSKALKWEQSRSNYVANEAALISSIIKATERTGSEGQPLGKLYQETLAQSSLAKAIATLYNNISSLRIAHLSLTPSLSLSLQIPLSTSISVLPTPLSPQLPGLWLTTANSLPVDDDAQPTGNQLGSHFGLLLLSDLNSILSDVNTTSSPITDALTQYLQVSTPTKSFYQISQSSGISLPDIQFLASHLIYWRRARAIPPLHQRDTYIVSPNADMRKLSSATSAFAKVYPALPPLPQVLSVLSSRLRPYSGLIPSKDHKETYMDVLAWLMRGGWVTQLRTFAWVRVPGHIKESVEKQQSPNEPTKSPNNSTTNESESSTDESDVTSTSHLDVPHPHSHLHTSSPSSSTNTTLPIPPSPFPHTPNLIPNPNLASDLPSRHLLAISKSILVTKGAESHSAWLKCVRYFDGKHALETIPVREGWKRKRVKELVDGWVEMGVLVRGKHW